MCVAGNDKYFRCISFITNYVLHDTKLFMGKRSFPQKVYGQKHTINF